MQKFYEFFESFTEFYLSFFRGNEVEFEYRGSHFSVLPVFGKDKKVVGICVGKSNEEKTTLCTSQDELKLASLDGMTLGQVFEEINILWTNF